MNDELTPKECLFALGRGAFNGLLAAIILWSIFFVAWSLSAASPPMPVLLVTPDSTVAPSDGTLTLTWGTNNVPSTNFVVLIQTTTNLNLALSSWPVITNVSGLRTSVTLTNDGFDHYYSGGFSNARGFFPFTNVLLHPGLLQPDYLSGKRGI